DSAFIYCGSGGLLAESSPYCNSCPFQWKKNGIDIQGAIHESYTPTTSGNYSCTIANYCGTAVSATIHTIVYPCSTALLLNGTETSIIHSGVNKVNELLVNYSAVKIFPNPSFQSTTISFSISHSEKVSI